MQQQKSIGFSESDLPEDAPRRVQARMHAACHMVPDSRALRSLCDRVFDTYRERHGAYRRRGNDADTDPYEPHMRRWLSHLEDFARNMVQSEYIGIEPRKIDHALTGAQSLSFFEWIRHTYESMEEWVGDTPPSSLPPDKGHALRWREDLAQAGQDPWDNRPDTTRNRTAPVLFLPGIDSGPRAYATETMEQLNPLLAALGCEKSDVLYHQYSLGLPERLGLCGQFIWDHSMQSREAARIFRAYIAPRLVEMGENGPRLIPPERLPQPILRIVGHSMGCIMTRLLQNATIKALGGNQPEQYGLPAQARMSKQQAADYTQAVMSRIPALAMGMQMALDPVPEGQAGLGFPTISVFSAGDSLPYRMRNHLLLEQNLLLDEEGAGVSISHSDWQARADRPNLYRYLKSVPTTYETASGPRPNMHGHRFGGYIKALGLDQAGLRHPGPDAEAILRLLKGASFPELSKELAPEAIDLAGLRRFEGAYSDPFHLAMHFLELDPHKPVAPEPSLAQAALITDAIKPKGASQLQMQ